MKTNTAIALSALLLSSTFAHAIELVKIDYTLVEETNLNDVTTSDFGMLLQFDEDAAADIGGTARVEMNAEDNGKSALVAIRLYDYDSDGKMVHIGKGKAEVPFGESRTLQWHSDSTNTNYRLTVSPSRSSTQLQ